MLADAGLSGDQPDGPLGSLAVPEDRPNEIDAERQDHTDQDHRSDWDEYSRALILDADVSGQIAKPREDTGGESDHRTDRRQCDAERHERLADVH